MQDQLFVLSQREASVQGLGSCLLPWSLPAPLYLVFLTRVIAAVTEAALPHPSSMALNKERRKVSTISLAHINGSAVYIEGRSMEMVFEKKVL